MSRMSRVLLMTNYLTIPIMIIILNIYIFVVEYSIVSCINSMCE